MQSVLTNHSSATNRTQNHFQQLSRCKKIILIVFVIWAIQAVPKWTVAITADGELSAKIMKAFITPRAEQ